MDAYERLDELLTPQSVQDQETFPMPEVIHPARFHNFNSLLLRREDIKMLRLLPAKSDAAYKAYHELDMEAERDKLIDDNRWNSGFLWKRNQHLYDLPKDVVQMILWFRGEPSRHLILCKLTWLTAMLDLDDIILFQRGHTKSKMVKRSFPHVAHLHLWYRLGVI